jgi:hypothetical protein
MNAESATWKRPLSDSSASCCGCRPSRPNVLSWPNRPCANGGPTSAISKRCCKQNSRSANSTALRCCLPPNGERRLPRSAPSLATAAENCRISTRRRPRSSLKAHRDECVRTAAEKHHFRPAGIKARQNWPVRKPPWTQTRRTLPFAKYRVSMRG